MIALFYLSFVFATESTKMIGLGIATKIIRSGKMNRKKSLKIYAFMLFTFNAMIAVILFIFSKNLGKIGLAWASIVF